MFNFRPNFLCVGAQKSGTTTLHDILTQHPDIYLPKQKEAHFFDIEDRFSKGVDWWLENYFKNYNNEKIIGSITPEYLFYDKVPERIYDKLGKNIKLIFILRNPVKRAYSHYLMSLSRGYEKMSFEEAIQIEKERIQKDDFHFNHFSYLSRGFYYKQIARYLKLFDRENMLFLSFENDIVKNIDTTVKRIVDFLDVDSYNFNSILKSNVATKPRFILLNKILNTSSIFKDIVRSILPNKKLREKIIKFLRSTNSENYNYKELNLDLHNEILERYFLEDIAKLNNLTEDQFKYFLDS